ncbi:hypothetical protein PR048_013764 [Dryococelus australis]|uniref:Uncharacterized protein n=1 Tax=Dryococelus australis TaxID=614101 RepID=A0ABQ9HT43_9NEOP|nr:hypothetical protein PR048_013764 [Dryococelus australis]
MTLLFAVINLRAFTPSNGNECDVPSAVVAPHHEVPTTSKIKLLLKSILATASPSTCLVPASGQPQPTCIHQLAWLPEQRSSSPVPRASDACLQEPRISSTPTQPSGYITLGTPELREKISQPVVFHNTLAQIHFRDSMVSAKRETQMRSIGLYQLANDDVNKGLENESVDSELPVVRTPRAFVYVAVVDEALVKAPRPLAQGRSSTASRTSRCNTQQPDRASLRNSAGEFLCECRARPLQSIRTSWEVPALSYTASPPLDQLALSPLARITAASYVHICRYQLHSGCLLSQWKATIGHRSPGALLSDQELIGERRPNMLLTVEAGVRGINGYPTNSAQPILARRHIPESALWKYGLGANCLPTVSKIQCTATSTTQNVFRNNIHEKYGPESGQLKLADKLRLADTCPMSLRCQAGDSWMALRCRACDGWCRYDAGPAIGCLYDARPARAGCCYNARPATGCRYDARPVAVFSNSASSRKHYCAGINKLLASLPKRQRCCMGIASEIFLMCLQHVALRYHPRTAVAERLARSPPTKANRFQSPVGTPDFSQVGIVPDNVLVRGFSRGSPVSHALAFHRRSILTSPSPAVETLVPRTGQISPSR